MILTEKHLTEKHLAILHIAEIIAYPGARGDDVGYVSPYEVAEVLNDLTMYVYSITCRTKGNVEYEDMMDRASRAFALFSE